MLRVKGLYGHIQLNNLKSAILAAAFIGLFAAVEWLVWIGPRLDTVELGPQLAAVGIGARPGSTYSADEQRKVAALVNDVGPGSLDRKMEFAREVLSRRLTPEQMAVAGEAKLKQWRTQLAAAEELVRQNRAQLETLRQLHQAEPPGEVHPAQAFRQKMETLAAPLLSLRRLSVEHPLLIATLPAALYLLIATWWNGLFIRYAMRAWPLQRNDHPELYNLVENLAITAGLPTPRIEIIDSRALNSYASGLTPSTARIGLTRGLLRDLDHDELEAVIAHELTHIRYRDTRLMAITKACVDLIVAGPYGFFYGKSWIRYALFGIGMFTFARWTTALVVLAAIATIVATTLLVRALVFRSREIVADAGAIELTKNPEALVSALRKIAGMDDVGLSNFTTRAMLLSGRDGGLFATHPALDARV